MLVKVTHSPWRIPDGREKKSPINNYGELGFVVAFHRSLLIRLDYSSSETVDVMTIIILSIIEYLLLFSIF